MPSPEEVPVFVLCGGFGTRLNGSGAPVPKPMVEIGDRPLLAHILECYARHGFRRFVLCTGYRAPAIHSYFALLPAILCDFTVDLRDHSLSFHQNGPLPDWQVTLAFTGLDSMTGARVARAAARYLGDAEHFAVTYGDGLTDADLADELSFHLSHGAIGTVLAVNPPDRFGRLALHDDRVTAFREKPVSDDGWINGGFFIFRRAFLDYLSSDSSCVLEAEPLDRLAREGELRVYRHTGFWSCIDTPRDHERVRGLWEAGAAPWKP
ncbi:Glucose-1-phosphate cytidylyltransferase [bacterium HR40]|nr:Glucose-1-phosphate cytidylyltransferase [bacterium HR40]